MPFLSQSEAPYQQHDVQVRELIPENSGEIECIGKVERATGVNSKTITAVRFHLTWETGSKKFGGQISVIPEGVVFKRESVPQGSGEPIPTGEIVLRDKQMYLRENGQEVSADINDNTRGSAVSFFHESYFAVDRFLAANRSGGYFLEDQPAYIAGLYAIRSNLPSM